MLGLLYFGRLEKEKGVDGIIEMVRFWGNEKKTGEKIPFELFIFGSGSLEGDILKLASEYPEVHFFGWKSREEIKRYVQNCQYCLMPSRFLETFGLSALTALSWGLPVIGYKKGGLIPFIDEQLDLGRIKGDLGMQIKGMIEKLLSSPLTPLLQRGEFENYSIETRKKNIQQLLGEKKKILIVSDFVSKVGGIETYIYDVQEILEEMGYEVRLFGTRLPHGVLGIIKKMAGIAWGLLNFVDAFQIKKICNHWEPEVIWYNSTLRWLGWMPIWASKHSSAERWMMYHDLGYFSPFPSQVTEVNQIYTPLSLLHFIRGTKWWKIPFVVGKYITVKFLAMTLKKTIDHHLVPSGFMKDIVHKSYKISQSKISILEHFLQK